MQNKIVFRRHYRNIYREVFRTSRVGAQITNSSCNGSGFRNCNSEIWLQNCSSGAGLQNYSSGAGSLREGAINMFRGGCADLASGVKRCIPP